jgi:hypothetical protein
MDLERVGRGVGRVDQGARKAGAQGADHGGAGTAGGERGRDPLAATRSCRWSPVTPHTQRRSEGRPVEIVGKAACPRLEVRTPTFGTRHSLRQANPSLSQRTADAPPADRVADVAASVGLFPG